MTRRRLAGAAGQAAVELLAMVPLVVVVAAALGQVLFAGAARELAGNAAEAGAIALLQGEDAEDAARAALPGWARSRIEVRVRGRTVRVAVRPAPVLPPLADVLTARAEASAG